MRFYIIMFLYTLIFGGVVMDKIAVISDVHGNITALKAVIHDIESRKIDKIFCLGDSVFKGCNSDKVIDLLREKCDVMIKGNCDEAITRPGIPKGKFWTRDLIGDERAEFIYNLPISYEFYMSGYLIRLFHASPFGLDYVFNPMFSNKNTVYSATEIHDAMELFENTKLIGKTDKDPVPDIIGYGHIHTPNIVRIRNKTIFNPGSVGMPIEMLNDNPNDKTNKFSTMASYIILEGIYDSKILSSISFNLVRLPYDIEEEIKLIENSTLPTKKKVISELRSATNYLN